jgi:diguanylate cyclase (GGDEF)-like protein/PAS domain S-box-containing protein
MYAWIFHSRLRVWTLYSFNILILGLATYFLAGQQTSFNLASARLQADRDIAVLVSVLEQRLRRGESTDLDALLKIWGASNYDIVTLHAADGNRKVVGSYQRDPVPRTVYDRHHVIAYSDQQVTLGSTFDLSATHERNMLFDVQVGIVFLLFSLLTGWLTYLVVNRQQQASILQQQSTRIQAANAALQAEVVIRVQAETSARQMKRLYHALSEINQGVMGMRDQAELFSLVCKTAVDFGGMKMAWIGLVGGADGILVPVARSGRGLEYLDGLVVATRADQAEGQGPAGTAFRESRPLSVNHFTSNVISAPWHERAIRHGFQSVASFPLLRARQPYAVLSVYAGQSDTFDQEVFDLLVEMSRSISLALDTLDREQQRRYTAERLRQSEERWSYALESGAYCVWDWDIEIDRVSFSKAGKGMFGFAEDEIDNEMKSWASRVHADDRVRVRTDFVEFLCGRTPMLSSEYRLRCKDDSWKWVSAAGTTVSRDASGKVRRVIGTYADITARKQLEEKLLLASSVLQHSSEGMMVTDENNRIIAVNPACCKITGYSFEEVQGKNPSLFQSGMHTPDFYQAIWEELTDTGQWRGELWGQRKNGESYATWLTINTIGNKEGTIHRYVALFSDITERKKTDELIWKQANFDLLTGLPNRNMFRDRLEQAVKKSERGGSVLALLLIDLDQFKEVNDTLGHAVGDALLQETARRINACVRESDTVARLGGDEFTVTLSELTDIGHVDHIAQKIIGRLAEPFDLGSGGIYVSASIGITLYPNDATDIDALVQNADQAMYVAKGRGRNCYSYFTSELQHAAQTRLRLSNDLRLALERGELVLHYQPQVNILSGLVTGVEALVRWQHPHQGLLPPDQFISIAEDTGLILPLGEWVMLTACRQLRLWLDQGLGDIQMAVNLSARQFRNKELSSMIPELLRKTGIQPASLELEITESLAMDNPLESAQTVALLRGIGVKLSIDDFGTGHSYLDYLKKFPVSRLKLDRSFIINIATDPNDAIIVAATITLAHNLGLDVVAEGVETEEHVNYLTRLNCDIIQGYYFCRPLPASEAEAYIRRRNSLSSA